MTPYYSANGIEIYHADCRDVLPLLQVDTIITDPPYGIDLQSRMGGSRSKVTRASNSYSIVGDNEPFDPAHLLNFRRVVLWGGNHFASRLPDTRCWLIWDKRKGGTPDDQADAEIAWTNFDEPVRLFSHLWRGMIKDSEKDQRRIHPTQKPVALAHWCMSIAKPKGIVCDPYMGSGSTIKAAHEQGFCVVGIDIDERWCEAAARRFDQLVLLHDVTS